MLNPDYIALNAQGRCTLYACNASQIVPAASCRQWLQEQCLLHASSFQGARESFMALTGMKKYVPVCISLQPLQLFFPTSSLQDPGCIWISYTALANVEYEKKTCIFHFLDSACLQAGHPARIARSLEMIFLFLSRTLNSSPDSLPSSSSAHAAGYLPPALQ